MNLEDSKERKVNKKSKQNEQQYFQDDEVYLTPKTLLEGSVKRTTLGQVVPNKQSDENNHTTDQVETWNNVKSKVKSETQRDAKRYNLCEDRKQCRKKRSAFTNTSAWRCRKSVCVAILILFLSLGAVIGLVVVFIVNGGIGKCYLS